MEDKNTWCVYMHTSPSGKVYVGITCQKVKRRWRNGNGYLTQDKNGNYHQPAMARAILKYGWENFKHIIFAENLNKEQAEELERLLVALWKSNNPCYGYNIQNGGLSGNTWSEEHRKKMSERQKGKNSYHYGKKRSVETRKRISESLKGENNPNYGKEIPEETRKKIGESLKGEKNPMYGKHHTEEAKEKIRQSNTGRGRSVYCIELDKQWDSMAQAEKETGAYGIYLVLQGRQHYAGRHPETGEKLHWIEVFDTEEIK